MIVMTTTGRRYQLADGARVIDAGDIRFDGARFAAYSDSAPRVAMHVHAYRPTVVVALAAQYDATLMRCTTAA